MEFITIIILCIILFICIRNGQAINEIRIDIFKIKQQLSNKQDQKPAAVPPPIPEDPAPEVKSEEAAIPSVPEQVLETVVPEPETKPETGPAPIPVMPVTPPKPHRKMNLEKLVGENLFSKIGILALIVGIGFFVKFAIDNNWINEVARTVLGLITGFALWGIAYRLREQYRNFSSVLAGGGFAISFVTIALAYNFYHLFSTLVTLVIFVILSALLITIALRFNRRELALIAIIGSYIAPFLASDDSGNIVALLFYTTVITVSLFVISLKRDWWELPIAGSVLTWIIVGLSCIAPEMTPNKGIAIVLFSTVFFTLFSIPLATVISKEDKKSKLTLWLTIVSFITPFAYISASLSVASASPILSHVKGLIPLYIALVYAALFFRFYRRGNNVFMQTLLLWSIIIFSGLIIPIQFSHPSVRAIFFAIYALILTVLYSSERNLNYAIAAAIALCMNLNSVMRLETLSHNANISFLISSCCVFAITIVIDRKWSIFESLGEKAIYNIYGIIANIGCCQLTYSLCGFNYHIVDQLINPSYFIIIAGILLGASIVLRRSIYTCNIMPVIVLMGFILISVVSYENERSGLQLLLYWIGVVIYAVALYLFIKRKFEGISIVSRNRNAVFYSLIGSVFLLICIMSWLQFTDLWNYFSAGFSIGLIVCGAVLMILGMHYRIKTVRIVSLIFFGILLVKLISYDLWQLPMIGRIIVFVLLGGVLLTLSFLYQRLRSQIFQDDSQENNTDNNQELNT